MKLKNALDMAALTHKALNLMNSPGTSLPGKILSKIYPSFLREVKAQVTNELFAVTGTNGKTTTAGILAQILKDAGRVVLHNELGANMPNGIITTLALGLGENYGKKEINNLVIESDEAYLKNIFAQLDFDYLILTNLFPDQTDRYADPNFTASKIQEAVELNKDLKLIVNADDPNLDSIGADREKIYYGLDAVEFFDGKKELEYEPVHCAKCLRALDYEKRFYSQLGVWSCDCGRARPSLDIIASVKIFEDHSYLDVTYQDRNYAFKLKLTGLYNVYNALAAISAALVANVERKSILEALENYKVAFGREETIEIGGKNITTFLIKNPAGANETMRKLDGLKDAKLMIALNDQHADGRDVSWLWDVSFETLKDFDNTIYLTGSRADDVALRLKYANLNTGLMVINNDIKATFDEAVCELKDGEKLVVLTSYTALLALQKRIASLSK